MKKICVVTSTRAEYGLLKNTIGAIHNDKDLELMLVVTGTHLMEKYGHTIDEILEDGFPITEKVEVDFSSKTPKDISIIMGRLSIEFAKLFSANRPNLLIVLGDRYELIPICSCAMNEMIPIAHISGGEVTQGAIDDCVRHCVTKMSYLHFPGCEEYRQRIIQLGENPKRVFNFGDVGVENIYTQEYMTKAELEGSIGFKLDKPYFSVTFHPVTLDNNTAEEQIIEVLNALKYFSDYKFVISKANADIGGERINAIIDEFAEQNSNCAAFGSLGIKRYLALLKYSDGIIGNSSSGIVEAPCFRIPTINIGDRQAGRLRADSIIDCMTKTDDIINAIKKSRTESFRNIVSNTVNPYGQGETAKDIVNVIKDYLFNNKIDLKKEFYDFKPEDRNESFRNNNC